MDSEVDLSLPAPSTTHNSVETRSRRGRSTHTTWVHTYMARDGENSQLKFYIHYTVTPSCSTLVSTNMRGHLKLKHGINID